MQLLHKVASFGADQKDLKQIYITFCRILLEQSCEVWSSSLTNENKMDLERCQISATKLICKKYKNYQSALLELQLEDLETIRRKLLVRMARKSVSHEKMSHLFELNPKTHNMSTRRAEKYKIYRANTERYRNSSVIQMQHIISQNQKM